MVGRGCVSLMKDPFFPKVSPFTPHVPTIFLQFLFQAIKIFNLVDFFFFWSGQFIKLSKMGAQTTYHFSPKALEFSFISLGKLYSSFLTCDSASLRLLYFAMYENRKLEMVGESFLNSKWRGRELR